MKREVRGAQLAATALALGPRRMLIASGAMQGEIVPAGTHPVLDHRFTTERTEIVHYGDASRLAKVRRIARSPMALATLRVCRLDELDSDRNCGRCEKCVRTMLELHVEGALEGCPAFDGDLTVERVAAVSVRLSRRHQWLDVLHSLGESREDRRLRAAVRLVIARSDLLSGLDQARALAAEPELRSLGAALPVSARRAREVVWLTHRLLGTAVRSRSPGGRDGAPRAEHRGRFRREAPVESAADRGPA